MKTVYILRLVEYSKGDKPLNEVMGFFRTYPEANRFRKHSNPLRDEYRKFDIIEMKFIDEDYDSLGIEKILKTCETYYYDDTINDRFTDQIKGLTHHWQYMYEIL